MAEVKAHWPDDAVVVEVDGQRAWILGAVLAGTDIVGTWRPRANGKKFTLRLELWSAVNDRVRRCVEAEAKRLAAHRGLSLAGIEEA